MDAMKPVRDYAHVSGIIAEYDKKLKEYEAAGGDTVDTVSGANHQNTTTPRPATPLSIS